MKDSGTVIISLNRCRDKIEQCAQNTYIPDKELLLQDFVLAIAIHEHTHAAVREGVSFIHHRNGLFGKSFEPEDERPENCEGSSHWPMEVDESLLSFRTVMRYLRENPSKSAKLIRIA